MEINKSTIIKLVIVGIIIAVAMINYQIDETERAAEAAEEEKQYNMTTIPPDDVNNDEFVFVDPYAEYYSEETTQITTTAYEEPILYDETTAEETMLYEETEPETVMYEETAIAAETTQENITEEPADTENNENTTSVETTAETTEETSNTTS